MISNNGNSGSRDERLGQVLADLMRAADAGEVILPLEWLTQHPEFATELREFFEQNERLAQWVGPIRQLAASALHVRCPHCHNPIELLEEAALIDISCPSCGSRFSLFDEKSRSHYEPGERTLSHFELLDRVGVGAFGSVWKAQDTKLERIVAVKIPRDAELDASQAEMFLRDARAAARLKHPNIVSVHEVGKQDNTIYIVSDFVEGETLQAWTADRPLPLRQAVALCAKLAKALHHAHEAGVVHRDLKPGNIMMDGLGEPHIVDFGLAKRDAGEITMTLEGQILGTPAYMSPEQAGGDGYKVDGRADIYSLGVILFELLTGELPFRGDKHMLIVQILEDEPPGPRKLNSGVPRDLETICLKCLAKDPSSRYETGLSVAHDLERVLFGEPIQARPVGRIERTWRWCRRHPQIASLLTLSALLLIAITSVTTWGYLREVALRGQLLAQQELGTALDEEVTRLESRRNELTRDVASGRTQLKAGQHQLYVTNMELARDALRRGDISMADYYIHQCPPALRLTPWEQLRDQIVPKVITFPGKTCVAISPDGTWLAAAGEANELLVWNVATGHLRHRLNGHRAPVRILAVSPNGQFLASADRSRVLLWDAVSGDCLRTIDEDTTLKEDHALAVEDLEFSPDNRTLVVASDASAHGIRCFDLESFRLTIREGLNFAAFNHDGTLLAVERLVKRRNLNQELELTLVREGESATSISKATPRTRPAFHPFKDEVAILTGEVIEVLDIDSQRVLRRIATEDDVHGLRFSADGRRLVYTRHTQAVDDEPFHSSPAPVNQVVIHNVISDRQERIIPWFTSAILDFSLSGDGAQLATATASEVQLWQVKPPHDPTVEALSYTQDMDVGPRDYPQWGGSPFRLNAPAGKNIPLDWDVGELPDDWSREQQLAGGYVPRGARNIRWVAQLGSQTYGNPTVANGRIFIGTNNGAGYLERYPAEVDLGVLLCFEEDTGKFLWQHSNEKLKTGRVHDWPLQGVCSTPVVDGNRLWYVTNRGEVVCLDTEGFYDGEDDGAEQWQVLFEAPLYLHTILELKGLRKEQRLAPLFSRLAAQDIYLDWNVNTHVVRRDETSWIAQRWSNGKYQQLYELVVEDGNLHLWSVIGEERQRVASLEDRLGPDLTSRDEVREFVRQQFAARQIPLSAELPLIEDLAQQRWFLGETAAGDAKYRIQLVGERLCVERRVQPSNHEADVVWRFDMMGPPFNISQHNMANCSMLTADGLLFACTSNGLDESHIRLPRPDAPSFFAMDRETGDVLWTDNSPGTNILHAQWASPAYGVFEGQAQVIFPGGDGWLYSFDPQGDGKGGSKLLWKFDCNPKQSEWILGGRGTRNNIIAFPAIYDGLVYVAVGQDPEHGEGEGHLWCIDPTKRMDGVDVSAELAVDLKGNRLPHRRLQAVDSSLGERAIINPDSAVVWHHSHFDQNGDGELDFEEEFHRSISIPVIKDDVLYTADFSGLFHCINAKTGQVYWTYDLFAAVWGSPLLVDDKVYIGDEDGEVVVFRHRAQPLRAMHAVRGPGRIAIEPIPGRYQYEILNVIDMDNSLTMTPIVANNVVYIANRTHLYAIEEQYGRRPSNAR